MSRDRRAVIGTAIWNEASFRKLPFAQQQAYFLVYTQADLNRCGVLPYSLKRWSQFAPDLSPKHLRRQYEALHSTRHVILDDDHEELLVRTYVGHDGLLTQPLVVAAMVRDYHTISSRLIRVEVLRELRRLWDVEDMTDAHRRGILLVLGADPERIGIAEGRPGMIKRIRDAVNGGLRPEITDAIDAGALDPWPDGPTDPFAEALAEGLGKGSGRFGPEGLADPHARARAHSPSPEPSPTPKPSPSPTPSTNPRSGHAFPDVTRARRSTA